MIQQWEYRIEHKNINGTKAIVEYLNLMGEAGWENYQERDRIYYFKRPIPQPTTAQQMYSDAGKGAGPATDVITNTPLPNRKIPTA